MSVSQHRHNDAQMTQNQNNQMSEDPGDGSRGPDSKSRAGQEPKSEAPDDQDQSQIEAFGEEGAGIAAKE